MIKILLYHISDNLNEDREFCSRIPMNRTITEDEDIKRVCACDSISGVLTTAPFGSAELDQTLSKVPLLKLFVIDTEKLGIPEDKLVDSEYLYKNDLVRDAYNTGEYWIKQDFIVPEEDTYIIKVKDFSLIESNYIPYEVREHVRDTHKDLKECYREYLINIGGFIEVEDAEVPTLTEVVDVVYRKYPLTEIDLEGLIKATVDLSTNIDFHTLYVDDVNSIGVWINKNVFEELNSKLKDKLKELYDKKDINYIAYKDKYKGAVNLI